MSVIHITYHIIKMAKSKYIKTTHSHFFNQGFISDNIIHTNEHSQLVNL